MKITFILHGSGHNPVGGIKVVYEYANHLTARGHSVTIVHPALMRIDTPWSEKPKKWLRYVQRHLDRSYLPSTWFSIAPQVRMMWVPSLHPRHIPKSHVIIATSWETAEWVARYDPAKGNKYYLIQHLETWSGPQDRVLRTWKLPLHKIVIAKWLQELAIGLDTTATYIPNGLDFNAFGLDRPPAARDPNCVMMLFHESQWKGSEDGIIALSAVKHRASNLKATLFGVSKGHKLPDWIEYYRRPDQTTLRELYNRASIFVAPSRTEGWGLPAAEAMACGAAVVATDVGGHREFAENGRTALLVPAEKPEQMADALIYLMSNPATRIQLAQAGHNNIRSFTWERATDRLEALMFNMSSQRSDPTTKQADHPSHLTVTTTTPSKGPLS